MYRELKNLSKGKKEKNNELDQKKFYTLNLNTSRIIFLTSIFSFLLIFIFVIGYFLGTLKDTKPPKKLSVKSSSFREAMVTDDHSNKLKNKTKTFSMEEKDVHYHQKVTISDANEVKKAKKESLGDLNPLKKKLESDKLEKNKKKINNDKNLGLEKKKKDNLNKINHKLNHISIKKPKKTLNSNKPKAQIKKKTNKLKKKSKARVKSRKKKTKAIKKNTYRIQVASYIEEEYAIFLKENLIHRGYNTYIYEKSKNNKNYYVVLIGPFTKKEDAQATQKILLSEKNLSLKGIFIF